MGCVFLFNQHTELSCTLNFSYKTTWIKISMEGIVFYQVSNSCMDFTQLPGNLPRPLMICLHESDPNENTQRHLFQRNKRDERFESEGPCPPSTPGGPSRRWLPRVPSDTMGLPSGCHCLLLLLPLTKPTVS